MRFVFPPSFLLFVLLVDQANLMSNARLLLSGIAPPRSSLEASSTPPASTCGALVASLPRCKLAKLFSQVTQKSTKSLKSLGLC